MLFFSWRRWRKTKEYVPTEEHAELARSTAGHPEILQLILED